MDIIQLAATAIIVLATLPPLWLTLPSEANNAQDRSRITAINQLFTEYGPDLQTDAAAIAKVLQPAAAVERAFSNPRPARFLRGLVTEIGKSLDKYGLFDDAGIADLYTDRASSLGMDPNGFRSRYRSSSLNVRTLLQPGVSFRNLFDSEPGWGISSINYNLKEILTRSMAQQVA